MGTRTIGSGGWRLKKATSLVKLLALARGHRLHRERITDALWPDLDARAQSKWAPTAWSAPPTGHLGCRNRVGVETGKRRR